jgi:hypothetical protein
MSIQGHAAKRFPNPGYSRVTTNNYGGCAKACLADAKCAAFNFEIKERACVLIAKPLEYSDSKTTDIGVKVQTP